jgi:hypothetical protein
VELIADGGLGQKIGLGKFLQQTYNLGEKINVQPFLKPPLA